MVGKSTQLRGNLRLVRETYEPDDLPLVLTDRAARKEFERLTQVLVEIAIEINDLADGDPDIEPNGDECEDDDAREDGDGV